MRRLPRLAAAIALALAAPLVLGGSDDRIDAALHALDRGDGIAAEASLRKAAEQGAPRPAIAAWMGEALLDQGNLGAAREWLGPAQFSPATAARGWRMVGRLYEAEGRLPEAGQAFDRALAIAPRDPLLWVDIGRLRYAGGEQIQAVDAAQRALAAAPGNPQALQFRAQLLRDSAGPETALPLFERALEVRPNDPSLLADTAATLGDAGRATDALVAIRKLVGVAPHNPYAFYLQAVMAARAGDVPLARTLLARAGGRFEDVPAAMLVSGALELEAGNANVALGPLERLADSQGANPRIQALLARALAEAGDDDELIERFAPLAARADASAYLLTAVARAYENTGRRDLAAPLLDRAAAATVPAVLPIAETHPPAVLAPSWNDNPASASETVPYLRSLLAAHDFAGANRVGDRALALHPGSAYALGLGGDVALATGHADEALGRYRAEQGVRWSEAMLLRMTETLDKLGRGRENLALVSAFYAGSPESRLAARLSAAAAAFRGRWAEARDTLDSLRARGGNRDVRLLCDLSLAQLRDGDAGAALESATRAAQLQPASGVAAQAWAMALSALGQDPALARQLLDKAQSINGPNPLLEETRRKLKG